MDCRFDAIESGVLESLLAGVERPARYIDHELGAATSSAASHAVPDVKVGLCYPGTYEVGQSNQGLQILYDRLTHDTSIAVERVFLPWIDMIAEMREQKIPLFSLESHRPVRSLDILGVTMPSEMAATSILEVLDLSGIPLHASERMESKPGEAYPLVIGGGPCAVNPEPMVPFFDAFFIGEADTAISEIVDAIRAAKQRNASRSETLEVLAGIESVYIPAVHDPTTARIARRIEADFATLEPPSRNIVPYVDVVHDRIAIEIMRGCPHGCRFCQASATSRPVRERSADMIVRATMAAVNSTGMEEVSLTSLSTTDHSHIIEIARRLNAQLAPRAVSLSIPSIRVDSMSVDLLSALTSGSKKPSLTLAPEAGTQRMRDAINKNVTEEQLLDTITHAFSTGYRRVKLYFMIGLPDETDEDILGIVELAARVHELACETIEPSQRGSLKIALSVNAFVPKSHTPFQRVAQDSVAEIERKQVLLREALASKGLRKNVTISMHDPRTAFIEGVIARGGRALAPVIEAAWRDGALFEAYRERFDFVHWEHAFVGCDVDANAYIEARADDEPLPWEHISMRSCR